MACLDMAKCIRTEGGRKYIPFSFIWIKANSFIVSIRYHKDEDLEDFTRFTHLLAEKYNETRHSDFQVLHTVYGFDRIIWQPLPPRIVETPKVVILKKKSMAKLVDEDSE